MSRLDPQLDKYGFPIPATFDPPRQKKRRRVPPAAALLIVLAVAALMALAASYRTWRSRLDESVAAYYERRGRERQTLDDLPGALADLNRAASWAPDRPSVYFWRSLVRLEVDDVEGSLRDCEKALMMNAFAEAYALRSQINQRLGRHDQAIADAHRNVELSASGDPDPLNTRAYVRALAGKELEEGLDDVERAIELGGTRSAYLDTRGYLLFLLGRYDEALADLDAALEQAEREKTIALQAARLQRLAVSAQRRFERQLNENLSVLYHHRGEVREKLGRKNEAKVDFEAAQQLGYNPAKGVM